MELELLLKGVCMVGFFCEVVVCGGVISTLAFFKNKTVLSLALSFSGGLFLSISLLHILPDATHSFQNYFKAHAIQESKTPLAQKQQLVMPFAFITCGVTYLLVFLIGRVFAHGAHDHEYELSFINQPKKKQENIEEVWCESPALSNRQGFQNNQQVQATNTQNLTTNQISVSPLVLQVGMSIHAFFQCLAVGLQTSTGSVLSLAIAIFVHKWAEGLTLGLIYQKAGFKNSTVTLMIIIQGLINVGGVVVGMLLKECGQLVMAVFLSVSAGTFLYIATGEVLYEQFKEPTKKKVFCILLANVLISSLFFIEKV